MTPTSERLLRIGLDIAVRIRDEDPADVVRALDGLDPAELRDLAVLLAQCVDVSRPVSDVLAWTQTQGLPRAGRANRAPCGTPGGYRRHKVAGEDIDVACAVAYRTYESQRSAQYRRRQERRTA